MTTWKLSLRSRTQDGVWRLEGMLEPDPLTVVLEEDLEVAEDLGLTEENVCVPKSPGFTEDPYPTWKREDTWVVSGPLGTAKYKGTRYATWKEARAEIANRFQVVQFWTLGGRWFARVRGTRN